MTNAVMSVEEKQEMIEIRQFQSEMEIAKMKIRDKIVAMNGDDFIGSYVDDFLKEKSTNTKKNYIGDIREFFRTQYDVDVYDKENDHFCNITVNMIVNTSTKTAVDYNEYLKSKTSHMDATRSRKISALQGLFGYIIRESGRQNDYNIKLKDYNPFQGIKVDIKDQKGYGNFSDKEVLGLINAALSLGRVEDSVMYSIFAMDGLRKDEVLSLDIDKHFVEANNSWWIEGIGKRKKEYTHPVPDVIYDQCKAFVMKNQEKIQKKIEKIEKRIEKLKKEQENYENDEINKLELELTKLDPKSGRIFNMSPKTINNRLDVHMDMIGINKDIKAERNLTVHSFRDTTAELALEIEGTFEAVQNVLGHSDMNMSRDKYLNMLKKRNPDEKVEMKIWNQKLNNNFDVSEELDKAIDEMYITDLKEVFGLLGDGTKHSLLRAIKKYKKMESEDIE